jgi:protein-L-isoaspartate(D-aspartate) O-methyltransferase
MTASPDLIRLIMELRGQGVTDARLLDAIERVPHDWAGAALYAPAMVGHSETESPALVTGLMLNALKLGERMKVLEIGTGSGYATAILARLALRVYSVERVRSHLKDAEQLFKKAGISNVVTRHGDGGEGWPEQAPFDRILLGAAVEAVPGHLLEQLRDGGILVCAVGPEDASQVMLRVTKHNEGHEAENLGFVQFAPLAQGMVRDV